MVRIGKTLVGGLAAAAVLGALVGSASARNLSVDEQGFRITWVELGWTDPIFGIGIHCPVTLEGSFHYRTIAKAVGALVGYVTRAVVNSAACTGGHVTLLSETLPWHVTYEGFTGALPRIASLSILLAEWAIRIEVPPIIVCLARPTNARYTIIGSFEAGGAMRLATVIPGGETTPCSASNLVHEGNGAITRLGSTERILVRLI